MGQKINPTGFRLGLVENWKSKWFTTKDFARYIGEDRKIRAYVSEKLANAGISKIEIERAATRVRVNIFTARPGIVIGKKGKEIEDLRKDLKNLVSREVNLNIIEVRKPDIDAQLVADNIAMQIERRVNYRRAVKDSIGKAMRMGAEGIKIKVGGRLNGAEIARTEEQREGRLPLHTLRAEIDYCTSEAHTTYGLIGVKVWIFKGERYTDAEQVAVEAMQI